MVKDAVPLGECPRALVVKMRHHGDVLLAAPVLTVLKAHAPRIEVDALVYDDTAPMLEGHPALSKLHVAGRKWRELGALERFSRECALFKALRARRYDLLLHLSEHPRGAWLARTLGARYRVGPIVADRGAFWRRSFTHLYPMVRNRHHVEVNLDALRRIGIQPAMAERKVVFVPGEAAEKRISELVGGEPFVHMHPASRWRFKCWPAEKNAELIDRFAAEGHQVVVTAAPDETQMIDEILGKSRAKPLNLAGKLTLKQLGYHEKAVAVLDLEGFFDPLWAQFQRGIDEGFIKPEFLDLWYPAPDVDALLRYLEGYEPHRYGLKWTR